MNVIVIASLVVAFTILIGVLIAIIVRGLDRAITQEQQTVEAERSSINATMTFGYPIPVNSDYKEQLKEARKLAAKAAAKTPRGGNLGIGKIGVNNQPTAFNGLNSDPITAVKIAKFHGWEGLRTRPIAGLAAATAPTKAVSQAVAPTSDTDELVAGVDYPVIEITDDMSPAEKRKARIANAKAKSAAMKTQKEVVTPSPTTDGGQVTSREEPQPAATPAATIDAAVGEPVAGVHYEEIEITDDMSPDEIRKARIANAKAKSAAKKALREAGGAPVAVATASQVQPAMAPAVADTEVAPKTAEVVIPSDVPQPDFIEIRDDMDPDEVRKARIHNAKAKSAYKKALKEAGIDPASVGI